ncbi:hypothetical protein BSKO_13030 [Bryopsis sp. KO-2023]|nr:hypothetical protein BSKO_13030 [Bryopsis sp. KO-2023]
MGFGAVLKQSFHTAALMRNAKAAATVAILITLINHGSLIVDGFVPPWWQVALNFLVPFVAQVLVNPL